MAIIWKKTADEVVGETFAMKKYAKPEPLPFAPITTPTRATQTVIKK